MQELIHYKVETSEVQAEAVKSEASTSQSSAVEARARSVSSSRASTEERAKPRGRPRRAPKSWLTETFDVQPMYRRTITVNKYPTPRAVGRPPKKNKAPTALPWPKIATPASTYRSLCSRLPIKGKRKAKKAQGGSSLTFQTPHLTWLLWITKHFSSYVLMVHDCTMLYPNLNSPLLAENFINIESFWHFLNNQIDLCFKWSNRTAGGTQTVVRSTLSCEKFQNGFGERHRYNYYFFYL